MTLRRMTLLPALAALLSCAPAPPPAVPAPGIPFADAGRSCTDSDQCVGRCLFDYGRRAYSLAGDPPAGPAAGRCEAEEGSLGCRSEVRNGRVQRPVCVD